MTKTKAVIPMEVLRLLFHFPLPFAGITQTGSEGLPTLKVRTLSPMSSPSYVLNSFYSTTGSMSNRKIELESYRMADHRFRVACLGHAEITTKNYRVTPGHIE